MKKKTEGKLKILEEQAVEYALSVLYSLCKIGKEEKNELSGKNK